MSFKDKCATGGVGMTKLSRKNHRRGAVGFALEGCKKAIDDGGLTAREVESFMAGITKRGNKWLRCALTGAVQPAVRCDADLFAY